MVVVKSKDELRKFIEMDYKPYYHKTVKRWYLRKGSERHIIAKELEPLAKQYAKELELRKALEKERSREKLEEAIRLRSKGAPIQEVIEKTGISKSTFYRELDRALINHWKSGAHNIQSTVPPMPPSQQVISQITSTSLTCSLNIILDNLRKELKYIKHVVSKSYPKEFQQKVFHIKVPRPRISLLAPERFLRMFEDSLSLPRFLLPFRRDLAKIECPGCKENLVVEVPEEHVRISYKYCSNCGSLIEITWVNEEEY